ncbi:MAG: phosphatase PAP2 family protein [Panacagrimonas sp.]
MDSVPQLIAMRPLEVFFVGAAAVLLSAVMAWWIVRRLRAPLWKGLVWVWQRASRTWPDLSRLRLPVAWLGSILLLDLLLGFAVVLTAIGAFFEVADEIDLDEELGAMDNAIASELARSASPATLRTFAWVTHLGDAAVQWGIGIGAALLLVATGRRFLAVTWIAAVAGNGALNRLLKAWFERDRPLHEHGFAMADGWSFPSGHASGAVAVYGMLAYLACRASPPAWRLPIVLAALLVVLLVGYSRVVLQVHYVSDVLAGFLTAGAWLIVCVGAAHMVQVHNRHRSSAPRG